MKKLISIILAAAMLTLLTACGKTEEIITVYNSSDYHIDSITIAPEANVTASDEAIVLFDYEIDHQTRLANKSAYDYTVEIPTDELDDDWYVCITGSPEGFIDMYTLEVELGEIFENGTWGFTIDFDTEAENFVITPLTDSDI